MNLDRIQQYLARHEIDGWLLYDFRGSNPIALHVAGLQTGGSRRWFLWIPRQGSPAFLTHTIETSNFHHACAMLQASLRTYVSWQELSDELQTLTGGPRRIAMEYSPHNAIPYVSTVDAGTKELVEAALGVEIVSSADLVQMERALLSEAQMASHRRAAALCMAAKDAAFAFIRAELTGDRAVTEYDVQCVIGDFFAAHHLDPDHPAIVSVNRFAADPHYAPSAGRHNPIRRGDMVLIDLWARETNSPQDCFADITWTAYCGRTVPPRVREIFEVVARARDAAPALIQHAFDRGVPIRGYEVDEHCRGIIADAGYGAYIKHRTGHSLGPEVHFRGVNIDNLETRDQRELIPGVMFTIEPGIYLDTLDFDDSGAAKGLGIRSEINCTVHPGRIEVTTLPLQEEVVALLP